MTTTQRRTNKKKSKKTVAPNFAAEKKPETDQAQDFEHMNQVRNLLFGDQMRAIDQQLDQLQTRFEFELKSLKEEITTSLVEPLRWFVKNENESLAQRQAAETKEREQAIERLDSRLLEAEERLVEKLDQLDTKQVRSERLTNEYILEESGMLRREIRDKNKAQSAALHAEADELRNAKADRAAIAEMFQAMALQISGQADGAETEGTKISGQKLNGEKTSG